MSRTPTVLLRIVLFVGMIVSRSISHAADSAIDFREQIAPIFQAHCVRCHSSSTADGDLSLETIEDLVANDYVVAGNPDDSHLLSVVTASSGETPAMPKESTPLSDDEVALLRRWVATGAAWPDGVRVRPASKADASWWAYQPLHASSATGGSKDSAGSSIRSPAATIDRFIRDKLQRQGLSPSRQADRRTLIRRLSFDLHGLPPDPESVHAFVSDPDPDAYENLVETMLASPLYGEHFARH